MKIRRIQATEIVDSRGRPTVSTTVELFDGTIAKGEVPSGASTGKTEVLELRDGDPKRYDGKGVLKAVDTVNKDITQIVFGRDFESVRDLDKLLIDSDGTPFKTNLGGNSILSVSMAFCRAMAKSMGIPLYEYFAKLYYNDNYTKENFQLPSPQILVMEGGSHGDWATDIQEYMVIPQGKRFSTIADKIRAGSEVLNSIHDILIEKKYSVTVGFEGAFAPKEMSGNKEALDIIIAGIEAAGYKPGTDFKLSLDVASSEFYDEKKKVYKLKSEGKTFTRDEWIAQQVKWYSKYDVQSIEDPLDQEDWEGWQSFVSKYGQEYNIVGDDLLTTNTKRIQKAIDVGAANSVLIKLNQIGTVSETLDAIKMGEDAGFTSVISHRSGETNDDMIADLSVGTPAQFSKFGAVNRGERVAKYNRLMEIERELM